jgi:photosystem II stability/assembly factor-like uncharacterized protein
MNIQRYDGDSSYVVIGSQGRIISSDDGQNWLERKSGTDKALRSITWGKKLFVIVGEGGIILLSSDGVTWEKVSTYIKNDLYKVLWDGHRFITFDKNFFYFSEDGLEWEKKIIPKEEVSNSGAKISYYFTDIFWDGVEYIAVGGGNIILTSPDLDEWNVRVNSMGNGMFFDVSYNGERYVTVGDHLVIFTSSDKITWKDNEITINQIESIHDYYTLFLRSVVWGNNEFIAIGQKGLILASSDGLNWFMLKSETTEYLNGVLWDGKRYTIVGDHGTIIHFK